MSVSGSLRFTVIIPLFNKREFVIQAIESVLTQGYDNFDLLVVDDGSTDGSVDLVVETINDPRLQVIRQSNQGGAGGQARNTGMAAAQGEWFAFLDADDFWLPNHLAELAAMVEHVGQPALVSTRPIELPVGAAASVDLRTQSDMRKVNYFKEAGRQIGQNNCSSSAIHRDIFKKIGGFINVRSGPDLEYWARIALQYPYFLSDRVTSVYYRGNVGNMERIEAQSKGKQERSPNKLADVSPSLAMLSNKAERDPSLFEREDIRAYVNGRLHAGMRISLRRSDPRRARALYRLMIGAVYCRTYALALVACLPPLAVNVLNMGYDLVGKVKPK